jgi:hypothetical protein
VSLGRSDDAGRSSCAADPSPRRRLDPLGRRLAARSMAARRQVHEVDTSCRDAAIGDKDRSPFSTFASRLSRSARYRASTLFFGRGFILLQSTDMLSAPIRALGMDMAPRATSQQSISGTDLEIRLLVVHCEGSLTPSAPCRPSEISKLLFMSVELRGASIASLPSVHVLIVVVGEYLLPAQNLPGAGGFAQEIADFWLHQDRIFPNPGRAGSLNVLACDEARSPVRIDTTSGPVTVQPPTLDNVNAALARWAQEVASNDGSMGVLHWVGHGHEQAQHGGSVASLLCHGADLFDAQRQAGIDWASWLSVINDLTVGRQVYCFIDACRLPPAESGHYSGPPGYSGWGRANHVQVFSSTGQGRPAFWIDQPTAEAVNAGCKEGALGTRAFLAALDSYGAEFATGQRMPIKSASILDASCALVERWGGHQGMIFGLPDGPRSILRKPLLLTDNAKSLVDVLGAAIPPHRCEAQPSALHGSTTGIETAETVAAPHQFRLARKPHRFRLDGRTWGPSSDLFHPYMPV